MTKQIKLNALPFYLALLFAATSLKSNAQQKVKPANCSCIPMPRDEKCITYCLGIIKDPLQVQQIYGVKPETARSILAIKNRGQMNSIKDFKPVLAKPAYDDLLAAVSKQNLVVQKNVNGTNISGNGNTIIINPPGKSNTDPVRPGNGKTTNRPAKFSDTFSGILITVEKCVLRYNRLTCYLSFRYLGPNISEELKIRREGTVIQVDRGVEFTSINTSIAGQSPQSKYSVLRYKLIKDVVVDGTMEFDVGMDISEIVYLPLVGNSGFTHIPVVKE